MNNHRSKKIQGKKILVIGSVIALGIGFITNTASAAEAPLTMGTASTYAVLANAGVTTATPSGITGTAGTDIGVGNATAPTGTFSPTGPVILGGTSITALTAASNALADSRSGTATVVELGAGRTITAGAYSGGTLEINGTLTLDGGGVTSSVFIFRSAATLITGASSNVILTNGAQACNVFWQVGSSATLGNSSNISGHVIAQASVSTGAASTVNGQLIGITGSVTLGGTTLVNNNCTAPVVVATATPAATAAATPAATAAAQPARPMQTTVLDSCSTTPIEISTNGETYLINGDFTRPVTQVSVGGVFLSNALWTASTTEVAINMPAHSAGAVNVVLYNATVGALNPTCLVTYVLPPATLHVIKKVVNSFAGTSNELSFVIHVMQNGLEVFGSPATTLGSTGRVYTLAPGDYILSEERVAGYRGVWSGTITPGGSVHLNEGQVVTVIRTNFDLNPTPGEWIVADTSTASTPVTPTETGGVLPDTSAPWGNELLIGGSLVLLGTIGFRTRKFMVK